MQVYMTFVRVAGDLTRTNMLVVRGNARSRGSRPAPSPDISNKANVCLRFKHQLDSIHQQYSVRTYVFPINQNQTEICTGLQMAAR